MRQSLERLDVADLVAGQLEVGQLRQILQRGQIDDPVAGEIERLNVLELLQRSEVGDFVVGEVEQGEVLAFLEAGEIGDLLALGFEHEDVVEHGLGEVALGLEERAANGGFEILVGGETFAAGTDFSGATSNEEQTGGSSQS